MLLQMALFHYILWLSSILLCVYKYTYLYIYIHSTSLSILLSLDIRLLPCLAYYKQFCCEHWGDPCVKNQDILHRILPHCWLLFRWDTCLSHTWRPHLPGSGRCQVLTPEVEKWVEEEEVKVSDIAQSWLSIIAPWGTLNTDGAQAESLGVVCPSVS